MRDPVFTDAIQVCVVVRDLGAAMQTYVDDYGIGPWDVYEFNPDTVSGMHERGEPVERSWRLALSHIGQVQWELIQPLDEESIYGRFLVEHGEGVHHVGVAVPDYGATIAELGGRGRDVAFGGTYNGIDFAYLATEPDLGIMTEIFSGAPGDDQAPDATYP